MLMYNMIDGEAIKRMVLNSNSNRVFHRSTEQVIEVEK